MTQKNSTKSQKEIGNSIRAMDLDGYSMSRISAKFQDVRDGRFMNVSGSLNGSGERKSFFHMLMVVPVPGKGRDKGRYLIETDCLHYVTSSSLKLEPLQSAVKSADKSVAHASSSSSSDKSDIVEGLATTSLQRTFPAAGFKERTVSIKYVYIEKDIGVNGVHNGWTNLSNYISSNPSASASMSISVIFNDTLISSRYHFDILKKFGGQYTLHPKFIDGDKIVTERVECGLLQHFIKNFGSKLEEGHDWWDNIKDDFSKIFERVLFCLVGIYSKKTYHGNLINGIVFNSKGLIKLYNFQDIGHSFDAGAFKGDLKDLKKIMDGIIHYGYSDVPSKSLYTVAGIPIPIRCFLGKLGTGNFQRDTIKSLLDGRAFWGPNARYNFMDDIFNLLWNDHTFGHIIKKHLKKYLKEWDWTKNIPAYGPFRGVFEEAKVGSKVQPYTKSVDPIRYWRNTQQHYNKFTAHLTSPMEIEELFDGVFGICHVIRVALENYLTDDFFTSEYVTVHDREAWDYAKQYFQWDF